MHFLKVQMVKYVLCLLEWVFKFGGCLEINNIQELLPGNFATSRLRCPEVQKYLVIENINFSTATFTTIKTEYFFKNHLWHI